MTTFTVQEQINAPVDKVWATLADIGTIGDWNPGVKESYTTSAQTEGVGAERYCDLGGSNYLNEEVVKWQENEAITFRVVKTNMPFKTCNIHFKMKQVGEKTEITCSPEYELKFGPIGKLLDALMVKRTYSNGMGELLAGLKAHVEAG